jgi:hypothetical protein
MFSHYHSVEQQGECDHCDTMTTNRCETCRCWTCEDCDDTGGAHTDAECEEPLVEFLKMHTSHYHESDCPCGLTGSDWEDVDDCYCGARTLTYANH